MRLNASWIITIAIGLSYCLMRSSPAAAQSSGADGLRGNKPGTAKSTGEAKTTVVDIELLQASNAGNQFAQHWLRVLETLDVKLRVHAPSSRDKAELKQREAGNTRYVTAVGVLERTGTIQFPNKTFEIGDNERLKDWIAELRTYGALGTPKGQPLWGLTKEQFDTTHAELIKPVDFETIDLPVTELVAKLPLSAKFPAQWSNAAKSRLETLGSKSKVRFELKGYSAATVLAIALHESGLGFHPTRLPSGKINLLIEPHSSSEEQWPIGWPLQGQKTKALPKFFEMIPIELSDVELQDVLDAIETLGETPILIDYPELEARHVDLKTTKVSFPRKMTTWGIALNKMLAKQMLTYVILQDEGGRVFVWLTSAKAARARTLEREKTD